MSIGIGRGIVRLIGPVDQDSMWTSRERLRFGWVSPRKQTLRWGVCGRNGWGVRSRSEQETWTREEDANQAHRDLRVELAVQGCAETNRPGGVWHPYHTSSAESQPKTMLVHFV